MTSHCTACRENNSITGSDDGQTTDEYTAAWAPHAPTLTGSDDGQTTDEYTAAWAPHAPTLRPNAPTLSSALYNSDYLKQERKQRAVSILGDGAAASGTREIAEALNYDRQEKAAFVQERLNVGRAGSQRPVR